jgi:hypothetical protein
VREREREISRNLKNKATWAGVGPPARIKEKRIGKATTCEFL